MGFWARIYYLHGPTFGRWLWLHFVRRPAPFRILFTLVFLMFWGSFGLLVALFRLLDEIFLPGYRRVSLHNTVFIISPPRSGTTHLHRLMALDQERFASLLLYHTILPSALLIRLVRWIGRAERPLGRPLYGLFRWVERRMFGGWDDIHATGFHATEEDEGLFIFSLLSPGLFLFSPFPAQYSSVVTLADRLPVRYRHRLFTFYYSSLQRIVYAEGFGGRRLLVKNVMHTGRMQTLLEYFPSAQLIYISRDPSASVPSFISMFTGLWQLHSPGLHKTGPEYQALAWVLLELYAHWVALAPKLSAQQYGHIRFDDLVAQPQATLRELYAHFGWEPTGEFLARLAAASQAAHRYQSRHRYSLANYGLAESDLRARYPQVFLALAAMPALRPVAQASEITPATSDSIA